MKKIIIFALPLFFLLTLLPLDVVTAQTTNSSMGFVTCSGPDCSACNLVGMINELIRWLFGFIFLLFSVLMVKAGFGLVTSGGSQSALDAAKSSFQNAIIGLIIVMAAWLMVDTIMKGLVGGGTTGVASGSIINGWGPWSQVQCQVQTPTVQGRDTGEVAAANGTPVDPNITAQCTDDAALIARYHGSPVGVEAPALRTMINCYLADSSISSATDNSQLFTVDRSHPRCSLTNGNNACGPCSHSNNSMHYGRGSGQGARAVDFNASGGVSESALYGRLTARQSQCGGTLLFEGDHTHISL